MAGLVFERFKATGNNEEIQVGKSSPPWMVTYSDLVTQLLIFFVMMFALAATLNELQLKRIKKRLEEYAQSHSIEDVVSLEINAKGLVISLNEKLMFDSGKADIYEEAKNILTDISKEIIDVPNDIRIEGHTDSLPIKTEQFPSNWELSTTRATNISRFLIEQLNFPPDRLSAGGYSKYHPVVLTEHGDTIQDYKEKVRKVPFNYAEKLQKAKTEEQIREAYTEIRSKQLEVQLEMQEFIQKHIKAANFTKDLRSLNRRVDIIVLRLGSGYRRKST